MLICTFGDRDTWNPLAGRALRSAGNQGMQPDEVIRIHRDTLYQARRAALLAANTDWIIHLDADDELDPDYIHAMMHTPAGRPELLYPMVQRGLNSEPIEFPVRDLLEGNFMVIGTMVRRKQFLEAGGFPDLDCYEDWAAWLRMVKVVGCRFGLVRDAVYVVHERPNSRNHPPPDKRDQMFRLIRDQYV